MELSAQVRSIVRKLKLRKHPEGGYFRQTYCSQESIPKSGLPKRFGAARAFSTAIYFLLPGSEVSLFHRIRSDELWHFYFGDPLELLEVSRKGRLKRTILGPRLSRKQTFQAAVPTGAWMAARCVNPRGFTLVGCTVAPGFDFSDFEFADPKTFPNRSPRLRRFFKRP